MAIDYLFFYFCVFVFLDFYIIIILMMIFIQLSTEGNTTCGRITMLKQSLFFL